MMIKKIALATLLTSSINIATATEVFKVEDIQLKGLQRVAVGAALTHIPFNIGDTLNDYRISQSIKSLYKSGHFNDIAVYRDGNNIIYSVRERETISEVTFDGNKDLKDEQLNESLDSSDIRVGETLDKTVLSGIELGLEDFYHSIGKYNADVTAEITHLPRNRVKINFNFTEGEAAAIEQINIVGNELFTDEELLKNIELTYDSPWWNFMAQDRYQKQALQGDLESIESFYLDRGYLKYKADSTQVSMTPDKKAVYITLNVDEGDKYTVSDVEFIGEFKEFENIIKSISPLKSDQLYNGALVTYNEEMISKYLGRFGYAYPKITTIPEVNEEDKTVKLVVSVNTGKRVYVNRINFIGNDVTADRVLRREMRQMEGSWLSNNNVESSKAWLQRLPYMENVEYETKKLPGEDDLVDIDFIVKEQPSGSFTAGIGYGDATKLSLNAGIQQNNFLGTGNRLGLSINTVSFSKSVNISYTDPYFTTDGVSLGGSLFYTEFDAGRANLEQYKSKKWGGGFNIGFPVTEYVRLNFGLNYKNEIISRLQSYEQLDVFYDLYSDENDPSGQLKFETYDFSAAVIRNTLNRGTFPSDGSSQTLTFKVTTPNSDLNFFKVNLDTKFYFPVSKDQRWTFLTRLQAGYGNGYGTINQNDQIFPFQENFRAGGAGTLRGFEQNTVGPRAIFRRSTAITSPNGEASCCLGPDSDTITVSRRSVGGNAILLASAELIVPTPFLDEGMANSVRTSFFVDAGNVWDTEFNIDSYNDLSNNQRGLVSDFSDAGNYRASAGLSFQWLSPMGPMIFSFARTLKSQDDDDTQFFNFNIGQTF